MADLLLAKRTMSTSSPPPTVGQHWVQNFTKRHIEIDLKYFRKYDYQRAKCEDLQTIRNWFYLVQNIIAKWGIAKEDIYNFDKTGFAMGVTMTAKVITSSERIGHAAFTQPGNREWVIVVECINSIGWAIPPNIILKGKVHITAWYKTTGIPYNWRISVSENGWTNNKLGLEWIEEVFNKHT